MWKDIFLIRTEENLRKSHAFSVLLKFSFQVLMFLGNLWKRRFRGGVVELVPSWE